MKDLVGHEATGSGSGVWGRCGVISYSVMELGSFDVFGQMTAPIVTFIV